MTKKRLTANDGQPFFFFLCELLDDLVSEHQSVAELVDDDWLLAVHLVGQNLPRQVVQHQLLDGSLDGTEIGRAHV